MRKRKSLAWAYILMVLAALWWGFTTWLGGGLQYWSQGTYQSDNWIKWIGNLRDLYAQTPPGVVGLILGVALGICLTGLLYEISAIRARRRLANDETWQAELRSVGLECERATISMSDAKRDARYGMQYAQPRILLAQSRLAGIGIELDIGFENIGGTRFEALRIALHHIGQFLKAGNFELAKEAAEKHNKTAGTALALEI